MTNKEILWRSVNMWINYIQTGNVNMSTRDAINCGQPDKCKVLTSEQQDFVTRLEELRDNILKGKEKWYD